MTEAWVRVNTQFMLNDPRMLALPYEAKGLYITLWAMARETKPLSETIVWPSRSLMLYRLAGQEPEPDKYKVEKLLALLAETGLIILDNATINTPGFRSHHAGLDWSKRKGRPPKSQAAFRAAEPDETPSQNSKQFPDNFPTITEQFPNNSATIPKQFGIVEQSRVEQIREETQVDLTTTCPEEKEHLQHHEVTIQSPIGHQSVQAEDPQDDYDPADEAPEIYAAIVDLAVGFSPEMNGRGHRWLVTTLCKNLLMMPSDAKTHAVARAKPDLLLPAYPYVAKFAQGDKVRLLHNLAVGKGKIPKTHDQMVRKQVAAILKHEEASHV